MSIPGILWGSAGIVWFIGAFWQFRADNMPLVFVHIAIGLLNMAVSALYFTQG